MYGVYAYMCVVCVQLVAPTVLLLLFALMVLTQGELRLGLFDPTNDVGVTSEPLLQATGSLFAPSLLRSVFGFFTWWFLLWWFLMSLFGLLYERARLSPQK